MRPTTSSGEYSSSHNEFAHRVGFQMSCLGLAHRGSALREAAFLEDHRRRISGKVEEENWPRESKDACKWGSPGGRVTYCDNDAYQRRPRTRCSGGKGEGSMFIDLLCRVRLVRPSHQGLLIRLCPVQVTLLFFRDLWVAPLERWWLSFC